MLICLPYTGSTISISPQSPVPVISGLCALGCGFGRCLIAILLGVLETEMEIGKDLGWLVG